MRTGRLQRRPAAASTRGASSFDDLVGGDGQPEVARNVNVRHNSDGRSSTAVEERQTVMDDDIPLPFDLPAVARNDLDRLRSDPALKVACGRLPDTGRDLCSQPAVSRWENAPNLR